MWVRCDVCRRPKLAGRHDVDYRTKTFSCSKCGAAAYIAVIEPIKEYGMQDYRLDELEAPERHPKAALRLTGSRRRGTIKRQAVSCPAARSMDGAD
jgi:hypothetical protein